MQSIESPRRCALNYLSLKVGSVIGSLVVLLVVHSNLLFSLLSIAFEEGSVQIKILIGALHVTGEFGGLS